MFLFDLFPWLRSESRLQNASRGIAARVRNDVWRRVAERVPGMGPHESRGYIRARAAAIVHGEVDSLYKHDHSLKASQRAHLIDLASHELVRQIVARAAAVRTAPAKAIAPQRRAA